MFNFRILKEKYEELIGFPLYKDYGDLIASYRDKNTVVHPVCGVFCMQPMLVTAIPTPFIGNATALVEMVATPGTIDEVQRKLNDVAAEISGTSFNITDEDGKVYAITYAVQTAIVGEKTNLAWFHGDAFPLRQTISYTIVENGLPGSAVKIKIDGYDVPHLTATETQAHVTSAFPDNRGKSHMVSESTAYGLDFTLPGMVGDEFLDLIGVHLEEHLPNRALCVEVEKGGKSKFRIMTIVSVQENVQPPQNVGLTVSLAEISDFSAKYNKLWTSYGKVGNYSSLPSVCETAAEYVVFWGDGSAEKNPKNAHIYTDGENNHTVRVIVFDERVKEVEVGGYFPSAIYPYDNIYTDKYTDGTTILSTLNGESISVSGGRICAKIKTANGVTVTLPIDNAIDGGRMGLKKDEELRIGFSGQISNYGLERFYYRLREQETEG